jgi:hypothetical protein
VYEVFHKDILAGFEVQRYCEKMKYPKKNPIMNYELRIISYLCMLNGNKPYYYSWEKESRRLRDLRKSEYIAKALANCFTVPLPSLLYVQDYGICYMPSVQ